MIIHISGTVGSGKTYLGNLYKNKFNVIDTDDWMDEYSAIHKKFNKSSYIKFITDKMKSVKKNTLLVGILENYNVFPEINTNYKIFLSISIDKLFQQYNQRLVRHICKNKDEYLDKIENGKLPVFRTKEELKKIKDYDTMIHKKHGYKTMHFDKVKLFLDSL